jgi:hypothetical protein
MDVVAQRLTRVIPQYTRMASTLVREPLHRNDRPYEEKVNGWR